LFSKTLEKGVRCEIPRILFQSFFTVIITDEEANHLKNGRSMDSIQSSYTNGSSSPGLCTESDITPDEQEEKARLISQVLELQNTLDGKQAKIKILQICDRFA
jgi:hypothetical protein